MRVLRQSIVPVCVAFCAALAAHLTIDLAGDRLLAHDTYDALAHRSRDLVAGTVAILGAVLAAAALRSAFAHAHGDDRRLCASVRASVSSPLRFSALVVAGTLALVVGMEAFDVALAGGRIDGLADLLGGSLWLGMSCVIAAGLAAAALARTLALGCSRACRTLLRAVVALVRRLLPRAASATRQRSWRTVRFRSALLLARRLAGRAPPLLPLAVR